MKIVNDKRIFMLSGYAGAEYSALQDVGRISWQIGNLLCKDDRK